MIVVAAFDSLPMRLLGISFASFSSGTGAAGLVGAFLWWEIMPFIIPLTYFFLLPHRSAFLYTTSSSAYDAASPSEETTLAYTPLPAAEDHVGEEEGVMPPGPKRGMSLSASDKWRLGIAPTLLYPVPSAAEHPVLSKLIHSIRDYYPLWQLVYQTTVFLSRSSISLGIPPLPARLLSLPAIIQALILTILTFESAVGFFTVDDETSSIVVVFLLISLEGICGGLAYVNVFYRINQERPDAQSAHDIERSKQEKEFRIGSIGFSDSFGILFASLLAVPTEVALCRAQIGRGKMLCKGL
ncbi:hypothetical protein DXG01_015718 [Tephrocybe rancida]|nr:hypothetical protein DXG01_015718 [Tephrocybe rancida]